MTQRPSGFPLLSIFRARARGIDTEMIRAQERAERARARAIAEHDRASRRLLLAIGVSITAYLIIGMKMGVLAISAPFDTSTNYLAKSIYNGRADITDRNGELLATNLPGYSLYVHPQEMVDPEGAAQSLAKIFPDIEAERLEGWFLKPGSKFRWIKDQISPEQKQAVFDLGEPGLYFGPRELRLFPNGSVASHILGGVKFGEKGTHSATIEGQGGVEFAFNTYLSDPKNVERPLKLSLDVSVQDALENALIKGYKLNTAKGASAVLMEADTGKILAMASYPDFDPNLRPDAVPADADAGSDPRFNRAALGTYELGSTFKIFTAAQALESGYANPNTQIKIGSSIKSGRFRIKDFDYYGEQLSLHDVIVKSSNVGTARVAINMGASAQKEFLEKLGFLAPTKLELPEARRGQPLYPSNWGEISTMTISYGHGLSATPVHLAAGYATMVNGGFKVEPTLLDDTPDDMKRERIISDKTSMQLRQMLRDVVVDEKGTASMARTAGYDIGGKTGTADKPRPGGGYYTNKNINTFASAFPIADPKYVLVVTLDEPKNPVGTVRQQTAGWTVVPVAREIVQRVSPILGLRPNYSPDSALLAHNE